MQTLFLDRKSIFLILLGFLLTAAYGYGHFIDGDVVQILDKAHTLVTQGIVTPYGNVSTSGASGHTPGAFLTLVTGLPMKLWFSPWAALTFLALLHFAAFLMFSSVLSKFIRPELITFVTLLFWLNPWRMSEVFLWNPGYIFFVSALHMWSAFHLSLKRSFLFSLIHALSVFVALQIHTSFVILIFITLFLLWTRSLRPHWVGTLTGIALGFLSLAPYIIAGLEDPSLFPQPSEGEGKGFLFFGLFAVYPLLKGFWYWILFGSTIFQTHVFHQVSFDWLGSSLSQMTEVLWGAIKYIIGALGVLISFRVNFQFYKAHKDKLKIWRYKMKNPSEWLVLYTACAFCAAILATAIAPTLVIYWHLLMVWPMALIPLLLALHQGWERFGPQRLRAYFIVLVIYFTTTNLLAAIESKKHDFRKPFHQLYFEVCEERCKLE